jgi:hypothetical protein
MNSEDNYCAVSIKSLASLGPSQSDIIYPIRYPDIPPPILCGLVVRVLGYRSGGPVSIPGTNRKKNLVGLERGALSLVSTN